MEAGSLPNEVGNHPKINIKSKLRKIVKKARNLEPGPPGQEADPLRADPPPRWCFSTIILKNECPVQVGSKF